MRHMLMMRLSSARDRMVLRLRSRWRAQDVPDRKSTRLNSSHLGISYAVFCLKKKINTHPREDQVNWREDRDLARIGVERVLPGHQRISTYAAVAVHPHSTADS